MKWSGTVWRRNCAKLMLKKRTPMDTVAHRLPWTHPSHPLLNLQSLNRLYLKEGVIWLLQNDHNQIKNSSKSLSISLHLLDNRWTVAHQISAAFCSSSWYSVNRILCCEQNEVLNKTVLIRDWWPFCVPCSSFEDAENVKKENCLQLELHYFIQEMNQRSCLMLII